MHKMKRKTEETYNVMLRASVLKKLAGSSQINVRSCTGYVSEAMQRIVMNRIATQAFYGPTDNIYLWDIDNEDSKESDDEDANDEDNDEDDEEVGEEVGEEVTNEVDGADEDEGADSEYCDYSDYNGSEEGEEGENVENRDDEDRDDETYDDLPDLVDDDEVDEVVQLAYEEFPSDWQRRFLLHHLRELENKETVLPKHAEEFLNTSPKDRQCPICIESLTSGISFLSCGHFFHTECLRKWKKHSKKCPNCRK